MADGVHQEGDVTEDMAHLPSPGNSPRLKEQNPSGEVAKPQAVQQPFRRQRSGMPEGDIAVVRVGLEDVELDLNACAPQAAEFAQMRQKRRQKTSLASNGSPPDNPFEEGVMGSTQPQDDGGADMYFPEFPGGSTLLRNIIRYLEVAAAEERAAAAAAGQLGVPAGVLKVDPGAFHLEFRTDNISFYLEAAAMLRCPRLLRDTVLSTAAKELSSRRVLSLLERVIQFTVEAEGAEAPPLPFIDPDSENDALRAQSSGGEELAIDAEEDYLRAPLTGDSGSADDSASREQVVQAFCQVVQRLCARLDAVDFKLTASLAVGSPWASLEVLRAYRVKVENLGRVNYALQSVTSTVKSFFYEEEDDKFAEKHKQEWKEHHFALHVFRKHIIESTLFSQNPTVRSLAEKAMLEQENENQLSDEDDETMKKAKNMQQAEDDIPDAICDAVSEKTLAGLAGFVSYCDPMQTPPVIAAAMIRALLLIEQTSRAQSLFEAVFIRLRKAQSLVVAGQIPVNFLCSVKTHRIASVVLRRLLARHTSLDRIELCNLLEHMLLEDFRYETHCQDLVFNNALVQDIVVYCRVSTRAVAMPEEGGPNTSAVVPGSSGAADLLRLRQVGEKLFAAVFVIQNGFLPLSEEPDRGSESWPAGPLGVAECPWDSGDLDLPLLKHVPHHEDALHLLRNVLLRGLFRRQRAGVENDVPTTARLWALGRWPSCRDTALISDAFRCLSNCWRALRADKAGAKWRDEGQKQSGRLSDEESLFKMFSDLEFWRLQPRDLLTPWVPPQLLACHFAARCKLLDEQQRTLAEDNRGNLEEINRLRQTVEHLFVKLEAVDARSIQSAQKQIEVTDTLRTIR